MLVGAYLPALGHLVHG